MKKKIKAGIALLLAVSMLLSLAACGGDNGGEITGDQTPDLEATGYVYVPEFISINAEQSNLGILAISDDTLFVRYIMTGENFSFVPGVATLRTDGTGFTSIWEGESAQWEEEEITYYAHSDISIAAPRSAGGIYALQRTSSGFFSNDGGESGWEDSAYLMALASDGTVEREMDLATVLGRSDGMTIEVSVMQATSDGRLLLGTWDALYILSPDWTLEREIPLTNLSMDGMVVTRDDRVLVTVWDNESFARKTNFMDLETGQLQDEDESPLSDSINLAVTGPDYDLYTSDFTSVFGIDLETGGRTRLFDWMDMDMASGTTFVVSDAGEIFFFEMQWGREEGVQRGGTLVRLTKVDASEVPEVTTLTFGALSVDFDIKGEIIEFNKRNPNYRIRIREYMDWQTGDFEMAFEAALQRFNTDLLTGNAPDILQFSTELPFDTYARRGFLADMNPLLAADPELSRDDLISSVMDLFSVDSGLYVAVSQFTIQTLVGRSDRVGPEMGWTMAEFQAAVDALPEGGTAFDSFVTREQFMNSVLGVNLALFIDRETGRANFDSDLFRSYLTFANTLTTNEELWGDNGFDTPGDWARPMPVPPIGEVNPDDTLNAYAAGRILLMEQTLWGFSDMVHTREMFQGDVTIKGYPSEGGLGSVVIPRSMVGISANTPHTDIAWSFVRTLLTERYQRENAFSFATNRAVLEEQIESAMRLPEWATTEEDREIWLPMLPSQADVDQIMALIENVDQISMRDETVLAIVTEETLPYFAGDRSVEETVRIIQSRVQILISESR
ncbi:MAG: extracellular solute-binding protein [Oscillospiraceae bacterium]|nr:extracellular solute-binding protein [Oscillospiraceae bacterium]